MKNGGHHGGNWCAAARASELKDPEIAQATRSTTAWGSGIPSLALEDGAGFVVDVLAESRQAEKWGVGEWETNIPASHSTIV